MPFNSQAEQIPSKIFSLASNKLDGFKVWYLFDPATATIMLV